jgi:hypothetical protein
LTANAAPSILHYSIGANDDRLNTSSKGNKMIRTTENSFFVALTERSPLITGANFKPDRHKTVGLFALK